MLSRRSPNPDNPIYKLIGWLLLLGIIKTPIESLPH